MMRSMFSCAFLFGEEIASEAGDGAWGARFCASPRCWIAGPLASVGFGLLGKSIDSALILGIRIPPAIRAALFLLDFLSPWSLVLLS